MTNIPYEERIKNRSNEWYYNKCIRQYHFIIKSEGANQRYKEEIARLNKIIDELEKWLEERLEKLDLIGYDDEIYSGIEHTLNKLKELKEEGK